MQDPKNKPNRNEKRSRGIYWILAACAVLLAALVLIAWAIRHSGADTQTDPVTTEVATSTDISGTADPETTEEIPETSLDSETTGSTETTPTTQPTVPATQPPIIVTTPPTTQDTSVYLPYQIPNTTLELQSVKPYDGTYLEDGSDTAIEQVAMLLVKNVGTQAVEYAKITMTYGDKTLQFEAKTLGAGERMVVQESSKQSCASGKLLSCDADVATLDTLDMASDSISVTDNGNNTLTVTNLTGEDIPVVRIFYKYYMEDMDIFVGGITYTAKITGLKAGSSVTVSPTHYASSGSVVVMVRTYTEDVTTGGTT